MSYRKTVTSGIVAGLLVLASVPALAHAPLVERQDSSAEKPVRITWSLDTSIALYGYFDNARDVDVVTFRVTPEEAGKGTRLYLHTLVPACKVYRELLPAVAVVGPPQEALPLTVTGIGLPFEIVGKPGIRLLRNTKQGITWYEPYSKKNYFWQKSMHLTLTKAGEYTLHIWSPDQRVGDYVLAIGTRERWGLREIGRATRHMPRLLTDREIHNQACREELRQQTPSRNPLPEDIHSAD
jgi:hypothetical protein